MNPTCFSQILGNEKIKEQLQRMVSKRAIGHALLFSGPDGVGKSLFAWALAARIMQEYGLQEGGIRKLEIGQHPDVHVYRPEGKLGLHSIQALRDLIKEVHLPPYESAWKVFLIHDAERMLSYSANALLKTFEEPPPRTLIILLSCSRSALLPTIVSRCCSLHFESLPLYLIEEYLKRHLALDERQCRNIARQAQGSIGRALKLVAQEGKRRSSVLHLLAKGPLVDYRSLQREIQAMSEQMEIAKKQAEEMARKEIYKMSFDHFSVQQQQVLEKELEGLTALALTQEAHILFDDVLSWYRDLQLILLGGSPFHLSHPDFKSELEQAVQRGEYKPLEEVLEAVENAYLSLQRSTSLAICLENLFLRLCFEKHLR